MPAVELAADDPFVRQVVGVVGAVRGSQPKMGGVSFGTDGAVLGPALGAKLVIFGPGRLDQLHQTNEYIDINDLAQATAAYMRLARTLLGTA
jgi:acetylornithine deacetylase/succinyl-diaminopimelate desuccinylase-like protein